mgnify:FL=1
MSEQIYLWPMFNDIRPDDTEASAMRSQQLELDGADQPDVAWFNVGGDSYVANPCYVGPAVPHPMEAEANEIPEPMTADEKAEWLQVKFEELDMQEAQELESIALEGGRMASRKRCVHAKYFSRRIRLMIDNN